MTVRRLQPALLGLVLALVGILAAVLLPRPAAAQAAAPTAASAPVAAAQPAAAARTGGLVVPAGATSREVLVLSGPVDVFGTVRGDALVLSGDLTIHPGAVVEGDVISVFGQARNLGGRVTGAVTSYARAGGAAGSGEAARPPSPWRSLKATLGWFAILLIIGIGVLVSASPRLDGVAESLEAGVGRALLVGFAGQLLILPAMLAIVVALAVTIVGILAIPLGIVALVVAVAGLGTLGFLAVCFVLGRSMAGSDQAGLRAAAARMDATRALVFGLALFAALWLAASLLVGTPPAGLLARSAAVAVTWVAATAGFGAALLSRAGTRPPGRPLARSAGGATGAVPTDRGGIPVWQTPTPIAGIVAARRPTPAAVPPRE